MSLSEEIDIKLCSSYKATHIYVIYWMAIGGNYGCVIQA